MWLLDPLRQMAVIEKRWVITHLQRCLIWYLIVGIWPTSVIIATKLHARPCDEPIHYRIGSIDPRFGLSRNSVTSALREATDGWERVAHRRLFMFDPNADLPVNFIYTKEQQESSAARNNLDKIRKQISRLARKIRPLKALYQAKNLSFIDEKSRFERELQQYNHHVQFLNNMGGASESDGFVLDARKEEHLHQEGDIQVRARELESMEKRVNSLIDEYNDLVGREHFYVDAMNAKAGQQFVEGMYSVSGNTREINIYYISGYRNLVALLAHELGHARGIPHNEDPKSVMSPGGEDTTGSTIGQLQFSRSDKVGLNTVCPLSND